MACEHLLVRERRRIGYRPNFILALFNRRCGYDLLWWECDYCGQLLLRAYRPVTKAELDKVHADVEYRYKAYRGE
jgi:hypothetical protein